MMKTTVLLAVLIVLLSRFEALNINDPICIFGGAELRDSPCGNIVITTEGSEIGKVIDIKEEECSSEKSTWIKVEIDGSEPVWISHEMSLFSSCEEGPTIFKDHNVPQVHQLWDTVDNFAGGSACGPTSAVMAAAFYKRISPRPMTISLPQKHTNNFGWYVTHQYKTPSGKVLNRGQKDPRGRVHYGAWGQCTEGGIAWAWRIQEFFKFHNLKNKFYATATQQIVKSALNKGHLVILSTQLTRAGHVILVRGYDGNNYIVNDPYGNANVAGYGKHMNGKAVKYTWAKMKTKWMVEVWA